MVLLVVQIETGSPEQRIGGLLECPDHRPDAAPLDQPVTVACIPYSACSAQQCIELTRATHDHLAALFTENAGTDL